MKFEEIVDEQMFVLCAPDGSWQGLSLSPDYPTCIAAIKMLHKARLSESLHTLTLKGFKILPVKVSMNVNGNADDAFNHFKNSTK